MIRRKLAAIAAGIILAVTGTATAHATPAQPVQVKIYLENNNHNPGTVTADCGPDGGRLHTALFNDAIGANTIETAKIYREDGGPANAANWPVIFGPVDVPIGGHVPVDLPYVAGTSYNAVAIPKGDPWPTTLADIIGRLQAKPPTADNSQLFPSGYPADPKCPPPPPPNPCDLKPVGIDAKVVPTCPPCPTPEVKDAAVLKVVPTCIPATEPSKEPSGTPTSSKPTSSSPTPTASSVPTATSAAATSSSLSPTPTGTASSSSASTPLAHTGASVVPAAVGAGVLLAAGAAVLLWTRRARQH